MDLKLHQRLDLSLKLAPQIIQSIELLQLPAMDLKDVIEAELDTNEFLEIAPRTDAPPPYAANGAAAKTTEREEAPADSSDSGADAESWNDAFGGSRRSSDDDPGQNKIEAMNNTASEGPSLQEAILEQYHLLPDSERFAALAEQIVFNLDDNGYLSCPLDDVVAPLADRFGVADAEAVLKQIQGLDPRGVGARSIAECLLLQLDPGHPDYAVQRALLSEHFEDLTKNRLPKVARDLGITIERLKDVVHGLAHLTPHPGKRAAGEKTRYIDPDLMVEWNGVDYDVRLANEYIPELRLAPEYKLALQAKTAGRDYHEYVKKKVDSARAFIMAVEKRQKTLVDVGRAIVRHQKDFLDFGPHYLRPLKMQQVAEDLHIHVSTVSRAASGKFMQTHRGIFALKDFFTGGTASVDGNIESRESVKQKVKEIVAQEDRSNPLSDDDIVERLLSVNGIKVARRTVTKYRKALNIPSSRQRKAF